MSSSVMWDHVKGPKAILKFYDSLEEFTEHRKSVTLMVMVYYHKKDTD